MHHIAAREEHAEQAFLATAKLKADGTHIDLSREDHRSLQLFNRADRFLPHGWCLLPPLQTCDKGNACLTIEPQITDGPSSAALALPSMKDKVARSLTLRGSSSGWKEKS